MSELRVVPPVLLEQLHDYQFDTRFSGVQPTLRTDEPVPVGGGTGPDPVQLLCAAVGNCMASSLVFALRKYHLAAEPLKVQVSARLHRNERGRQRVQGLTVKLHLGRPIASLPGIERALSTFENGVLTLTLPKRAQARGTTLKIG